MTAAASIGEQVLWRGKRYTLLGVDPMSVADKQAELLQGATGRRIRVPLAELEPLPRSEHPNGVDDSLAPVPATPRPNQSVVHLRPPD
jgi:hypothetical protein